LLRKRLCSWWLHERPKSINSSGSMTRYLEYWEAPDPRSVRYRYASGLHALAGDLAVLLLAVRRERQRPIQERERRWGIVAFIDNRADMPTVRLTACILDYHGCHTNRGRQSSSSLSLPLSQPSSYSSAMVCSPLQIVSRSSMPTMCMRRTICSTARTWSATAVLVVSPE
jgi:hypothetical protein